MNVELIDTNILVYAYDLTAGKKRRRAAELIGRLTRDQSGVLSVQVLVELYVTLTRKLPRPLAHDQALEIVSDFATWPVFAPEASDALEAMRIAARYRISIWNALIVEAAASQKAEIIWSEDLSSGQLYEGVEVKNPFKS